MGTLDEIYTVCSMKCLMLKALLGDGSEKAKECMSKCFDEYAEKLDIDSELKKLFEEAIEDLNEQ